MHTAQIWHEWWFLAPNLGVWVTWTLVFKAHHRDQSTFVLLNVIPKLQAWIHFRLLCVTEIFVELVSWTVTECSCFSKKTHIKFSSTPRHIHSRWWDMRCSSINQFSLALAPHMWKICFPPHSPPTPYEWRKKPLTIIARRWKTRRWKNKEFYSLNVKILNSQID